MSTLTEKYLKDINACKDGISFAKRNNLIGFPLKDLDKISGDFNEYVDFLKRSPLLEYDSNGNVIKKTYLNGRVYLYEHNSKGATVKETYHDDGIVYFYLYEYDLNGNVIKKTLPDGDVDAWNYSYYNNGQLAKIEKDGEVLLEIPEFQLTV